MKNIFFIFAVSIILFTGCVSSQNVATFNQKNRIVKTFGFNTGSELPLTTDQSVETDGDISFDANYFFYSSNKENGNYEIYLRDLKDIRTIRLTNHPSEDFSPKISPDGKKIIFISKREDPEGDIYLAKINPEKILKNNKPISIGKNAENLTENRDAQTKILYPQKDSSPSWSHDGGKIVYTVFKNGMENIWVMDDDGDNKIQITFKGGVTPSFSNDDKLIVFTSYRNNNKGDIFIINLLTKKTMAITNSPSIKMSPSFTKSNNEIIFTEIDKDTNHDNKINLKDKSQITYMDIRSKIFYPITTKKNSPFKGKWFNVFKSNLNTGIVVFSSQNKGNIDIAFLPDNGIIPIRRTAKHQYELAFKFLNEFHDYNKYLMSLNLTYQKFKNNRRMDSNIFVSKALFRLIKIYEKSNPTLAKRYLKGLKKLSKIKNNLYGKIKYKMLTTSISEKKLLEKAIQKSVKNKRKFIAPFLMEDLADYYYKNKNRFIALKIYKEIISSFPKYKQMVSVKGKYASLNNNWTTKDKIESIIYILKRGSKSQKFRIYTFLINSTLKNSKKIKISTLLGISAPYKKNKRFMELINYLIALKYNQQNNKEQTIKYLKKSLAQKSYKGLIYYKSNQMLGTFAERNNDFSSAEKYYFYSVITYSNIWNDNKFPASIKWLINFYERYGQRDGSKRNQKKSLKIYKKYAILMSFINRRKKFNNLYNKYAPRAHLFYINSFLKFYGKKDIFRLEKKYFSNLIKARIEFDKAYIYGLAYVYFKKALYQEKQPLLNKAGESIGIDGLIINTKKSLEQLQWASFFDETFLEPYLLKSWIYIYLSTKKNINSQYKSKITKAFPAYLIEKNILMLKKAISQKSNNKTNREITGNLYLNLANSYFVLSNFPKALQNYKMVAKKKRFFTSKKEEAFFHFHFGYCLWQNGDTKNARQEILSSFNLYKNLINKSDKKNYSKTLFTFYKYFALFNQTEKNYQKAISWYEKIIALPFAKNAGVDNSRLNLEIAHCYIKLEQYKFAEKYLDRADFFLKTEKNSPAKFYVKMKIFGFGPFSIYNLGLDKTVIGDTKLFKSLTKNQKVLYAFSLKEKISLLNNNYKEAIKIIQKKVSLLEKSDKNDFINEMLIIAYNNLGFYYFKLKNIVLAKKYFEKALNYSIDPDVENNTGFFISIKNLTNLLGFLIDTKNSQFKFSELDRLEKKINNFRNKIFKEEFDDATEKFKDKDKHKGKVELIKKEINEELDEDYYPLITLKAIINFYRAEFSSEKKSKISSNIYNDNKKIFTLYNRSLQGFSQILDNFSDNLSIKNKLKLKINIALCNLSLGKIPIAYSNLLSIEDDAQEFRLLEIQFDVYYKIEQLLKNHGKELTGINYKNLEQNYLKKMIALVDNYPLFFLDKLYIIKKVYKDYRNLLLSQKKYKLALAYSLKKERILRLLLLAIENPNFFYKKDRSLFKKYLFLNNKKIKLANNISKILIKDESESPEYSKLQKKLSNISNKINYLIKNNNNINISNYLNISLKLPKIKKEITVYKMFNTGKKFMLFKLSNNSIKTYRNIKSILKILTTEKKSQLFFVLNKDILSFIKSFKEKNNLQKINYIMQIDDINRIIKTRSIPLLNVYWNNTIDKKEKFNFPLTKEKNQASILFGTGKNRISTDYIFANRILSSFAITDLPKDNLDKLLILNESLKYNNINNFIILDSFAKKEKTKKIIESLLKKDGKLLNDQATIKLSVGNFNFNSQTKNKKNIINFLIKKFKVNLRKHKLEDAKNYLQKWLYFSKDKKNYFYYLTKLEILNGNIDFALKTINKSLQKFPGEKNNKIYKLYLLLYEGKTEDAIKYFNQNKAIVNQYSDSKYFKAIIALIKKNSNDSFKIFSTEKKNNPQILPTVRLKLLLSEYLLLTHPMPKNYFKVLNIQNLDKSILTKKEKLKSFFLESLINKFDQKNLSDFYKTNFKLKKYVYKNNIKEIYKIINDFSFQKILKNSSWLDKIYFYNQLSILLYNLNDFSKAILYSQKAIKILEKKHLGNIYNYHLFILANAYFKSMDYRNAIYFAKKLTSRESSIKYKFILPLIVQSELELNLLKDAAKNLSKLQSVSTDSTSKLLKINLTFKKLAQMKKVNPNQNFNFIKEYNAVYSNLIEKPIFSNKIKIHIFNMATDYYVNYLMAKRQYSTALKVVETKKFIDSINAFSKTKSNKNAFFKNYLKNLQKIKFSKLQNKISKKSLFLYFAKAHNKIYIWVLGKKIRKVITLKIPYSNLKKIENIFYQKEERLEDVAGISKKFTKIFKILTKNLKGKKQLLIATDNSMQSFPFEIIGTKKGYMYAEKYSIFYLSNLDFRFPATKKSLLRIIGKDTSLNSSLIKVAVKESGINITKENKGNALILDKISYSNLLNKFFIASTPLRESSIKANSFFVSNKLVGISSNQFAVFSKKSGISAIIVNNSSKSGLNIPIFNKIFYYNLLISSNILKSFTTAKKLLMKNQKFSHPAYWRGIRLFIN